ncbi:MAG: hypothetical protein Roseis2KO_40690 [Roseivirga sp.]
MPKLATFILCLISSVYSLHAQKDPIVIGTKNVIHSNVLQEDREYWVSLPESYHQQSSSHKRYPLLVVLDGRSHFRSVTGVVNYMSFGYNSNRKVPEMIVVAVRNVNRERDFTPDKIITRRKNNTGGGDRFLSFLEDELVPQIDKEFRTEPYRILFGHSLAGLLATHAYMKEKTLFNAFIAVDPSFGSWDAPTMDKKLAALTDQSFNRFLYMATANWGKRNIRNRNRHVRLYESLNSLCDGEFTAKLEYFENENHGSVPLPAFYNGISTIFEGYGISDRDIESKEQLLQQFRLLSQQLSYTFTPPETLVNRIAYRMLRSGNEDNRSKAMEFFILNTENYPDSFNAFDSLGEAYEALGDKKKAVSSYQKSLELNQKNEHASERIESLDKK